MSLNQRIQTLTDHGYDFTLIAALLDLTADQVEEAWRGVTLSEPSAAPALSIGATNDAVLLGFTPNSHYQLPGVEVPAFIAAQIVLRLDASQESSVLAELRVAETADALVSAITQDVLLLTTPAFAGAAEGANGPPALEGSLNAILPAGWFFEVTSQVRSGNGSVLCDNLNYQTLT